MYVENLKAATYWVQSNPSIFSSFEIAFEFLCLNVCLTWLSEWSRTFSSRNYVYYYKAMLYSVRIMYLIKYTAISSVCIIVLASMIPQSLSDLIRCGGNDASPPKFFLSTIFTSSTNPSAQDPNPQLWISLTHCANFVTFSSDSRLALHSLRIVHPSHTPSALMDGTVTQKV